MDTVKLLLITVLPALLLGCIVGIVTGKHRVKKLNNQLHPVLTTRQRIVYSVSIALGVACILTGIFYNPQPAMDDMGMEGMYGGEDMYGDMYGEMDPGLADPIMEGDLLLETEQDVVDDNANAEGGEAEPVEEAVPDVELEVAVPAPSPGTAVARPSGGSGVIRVG